MTLSSEQIIFITLELASLFMVFIMAWHNLSLYKINIKDPITSVLVSAAFLCLFECIWTLEALLLPEKAVEFILAFLNMILVLITFTCVKRLLLIEVVEIKGGLVYKALLLSPTIAYLAAYLLSLSRGTFFLYDEANSIIEYGEGALIFFLITGIYSVISLVGIFMYEYIRHNHAKEYYGRIHTTSVFILIFFVVLITQAAVNIDYASVSNAYAISLFYLNTKMNTAKMVKKIETNSKVEADFKTARKIQAGLLKTRYPYFPERKDFDIYAKLMQSKHGGGDYYDYYLIDDDHLGLTVCDVEGEGIPAALMMVTAKTVMKNDVVADMKLERVIKKINARLIDDSPENLKIATWIGVLELSTGILTYVNAGHEKPLISHKGERFSIIDDKTSGEMELSADTTFECSKIELKPGDEIFWYSDGVKGSCNPQGKPFGIDSIIDAISLGKDASIVEKFTNVENITKDFIKAELPEDDLLGMILRYNGKEE